MISVCLWLDPYSFYDVLADIEYVSESEMKFNCIGKSELKYLDYWVWFWESAT
jgi:hypothetical protein